MSRILIFAAILYVCAVSRAEAGPSVQFPTGPAAWTVEVTESKTAATPVKLGGVAVKSVEVVQNSRIRSNSVTFFNGTSRTTYQVTGTNLLLTQDSNGTVFMIPVSAIYNVPYLPNSFDWVAPSALQEKDPIFYQGKMCFHYKGAKAEAWVDSKTNLPVALDDGVALATFTFHAPPDTPLVLPPKYKQILDHYAAVMGLPKAKSATE